VEKMFARRFSNHDVWLELIYAYAATFLIFFMFGRFELNLFKFAVNFFEAVSLLLRF
jgi:hypothetical protein